MSKRLDDLLTSPRGGGQSKEIPPETRQAIVLLKIEGELVNRLRVKAGIYSGVLFGLQSAITEGNAGPEALESQAHALQQSRETLIEAINHLSAFGNDPQAFVPVARQLGIAF